MKTEWDYTVLAEAYLKRPDYSPEAIDELIVKSGCSAGSRACDLGAGAGHLTLMLAERGLRVVAVEPNDAMRRNGVRRTAGLENVTWYEGTGERTGQGAASFDLVTFGSSFNVTDRPAALIETARILRARGWFACLWNHRDLEDPIQASVEAIIADRLTNYEYGTRREDQSEVIVASGLFDPVVYIEGRVTHNVSIEDAVEAWRSHGTLARQAGSGFNEIVEAITAYLESLNMSAIRIPYVTRMWAARVR